VRRHRRQHARDYSGRDHELPDRRRAADGGRSRRRREAPGGAVRQAHAALRAGEHVHRPARNQLKQIEHFFAHYKDLEPGKWVKIVRWGDAEEAHRSSRRASPAPWPRARREEDASMKRSFIDCGSRRCSALARARAAPTAVRLVERGRLSRRLSCRAAHRRAGARLEYRRVQNRRVRHRRPERIHPAHGRLAPPDDGAAGSMPRRPSTPRMASARRTTTTSSKPKT